MKKILCYGDSNTYGFIPETGARYSEHERWSGILKELLSSEFFVIEEGMNNRTGFFTNPAGLQFSGNKHLSVCLKNYDNIDICILALGTNDSHFFYNLDENIAKTGLENLINILRNKNKEMKIIIIPPVKITEDILHSGFSVMFNKKSIEIIREIFPIFEVIAKENNCYYFDFNQIVTPSKTDGLHYTASSHKIIAENLSNFIRNNI